LGGSAKPAVAGHFEADYRRPARSPIGSRRGWLQKTTPSFPEHGKGKISRDEDGDIPLRTRSRVDLDPAESRDRSGRTRSPGRPKKPPRDIRVQSGASQREQVRYGPLVGPTRPLSVICALALRHFLNHGPRRAESSLSSVTDRRRPPRGQSRELLWNCLRVANLKSVRKQGASEASLPGLDTNIRRTAETRFPVNRTMGCWPPDTRP
jgi:hypothetical protein